MIAFGAGGALETVAPGVSGEFFDEQDLFVKNAFVDEGTTLKRFQPRAQGRAFQIKKRTSHITVHVTDNSRAKARATGGTR